MKVAVFQTDPALLDVQANLEEVIAKIRYGKEKGAQLIVFPELALTGYFVGDRYHEAALRLDSQEIQRIAAATRGTAAVVGFIEESPSMNFYNSALVAVDGRISFANRKLNLPNYGVFGERKLFAPGKQVRVFRLHDMTLAVFICNDVWHPSIPYLGVCQKADVFVTVLNSAEESMGAEFSNRESWEIINKFYSRIFGVYSIAANRAGTEGAGSRDAGSGACIMPPGDDNGSGYRFWGGSEVINPYGQEVARAALYEPDEIFADISRELRRKKKIHLPYLRSDDPYFTHRELYRILYGKTNNDD